MGFTLIELMIVIAIVAILVSIAVPAYRNYTVKAKVSECIAGSAPYKTSVSEFKQVMGKYPANMAEAGIYDDTSNNASQYCSYYMYNNVRGDNGDFAVEVDMAAIDSGLSGTEIAIVLSPVEAASGAIDWHCTRGWGTSDRFKYLPAQCHGPNIYK
jgi:type IV pilus assembly protein PilA